MSAIVVLAGEGKALMHGSNGGGTVIKLKSADTGGAFALVEHLVEPAWYAAPHRHENEDEFSYVLEGEITLQVGDEVIHAPAGTLVSKPRGIFHTFWNSGTSLARILEIVSPAGLERFFQEAGEAFAAGTSPERMVALARKYGCEVDMSRAAEYMQKYNLKMPGMPPQPR